MLALLILLTSAYPASQDEQLAPVEPTDEPAETPAPSDDVPAEVPSGPPLELAPPAWTLDPITEAALTEVGSLFQRGLDRSARDAALSLVDQEDPRVQAAAWMAVGMIERERNDPRAAMRALDEVRALGGPLAEIATWTLADLAAESADRLGTDLRAIEVCEAYRLTWPRGHHAADCLAVLALSYARLGRADDARNAAAAWHGQVRRESISEQVETALATHAVRHLPPDQAPPPDLVPALRSLATRFRSPQVGMSALRLLEHLANRGVPEAAVPLSLTELQARAISLRDAGMVDAAWDAWNEVRRSGEPAAQPWLDQQLTTFGWATRQWDALEVAYRERFARSPSSELAWDAWRAASRGGRFDAARGWLHEAQTRWPGSSRFTASAEMVGRTLLIGGDPGEAADWFDRLAGTRGSTARRNLFLAGFAWMLQSQRLDAGPPATPTVLTPHGGETAATPAAETTGLLGPDGQAAVAAPPVTDPFAEALAAFDLLITTGGEYAVEARYWRAKLMDPYDPQMAAADRDWVHTHAHDSWHALLLRRDIYGSPRDGRLPPPLPPLVWSGVPVDPLFGPRGSTRGLLGGPGLLGRLRWGPTIPDEGPTLPDTAYPAGPFHDPDAARAAFFAFSETWASRWPELSTAADLARVGLYDLSGPLLASAYDEIRAAAWRGDRQARSASASLAPEHRLPLFLFVRDHHHTARDTVGLQVGLHDAEARLATERLQMPLAFPRPVWRHATRAGLDPLLVLSIMRAESTYNPNAVSRAGARGPMQILPRTGHLLAGLHGPEGDTSFTARSLHDPLTAVAYGIRYLGLLNERFEGVVPLAVAAYNAGPHNVGAWMEGMGPGTPLDVFCEAIPFVETRNYVRKVMLAYDRYVTLHGPPDAHVVLPSVVAGNRASVVDF